MINYLHSGNRHTLAGPAAAVETLFRDAKLGSVLDVGCGTGTWLQACQEKGARDIFGIDGIDIDSAELHFPKQKFQCIDLTQGWRLDRHFDIALCLEVGEHLPPSSAATLVSSLVQHSDHILFSAACPGQDGQHHVNCQWPSYWQALFNAAGFACEDSVRWKIWEIAEVEWWYRQNLFSARRNPALAGKEPRIASVVHPMMLQHVSDGEAARHLPHTLNKIEIGALPINWYISRPAVALMHKLMRKLRVGKSSQ